MVLCEIRTITRPSKLLFKNLMAAYTILSRGFVLLSHIVPFICSDSLEIFIGSYMMFLVLLYVSSDVEGLLF